MGVFMNAPLEELANGNVTPAVAKAPWYFLGLQELLAYFHPTVAGVLVPTLRARGRRRSSRTSTAATSADVPALRAQDGGRAVLDASARSGSSLTFVGIFFRGPGYAFVIPYRS